MGRLIITIVVKVLILVVIYFLYVGEGNMSDRIVKVKDSYSQSYKTISESDCYPQLSSQTQNNLEKTELGLYYTVKVHNKFLDWIVLFGLVMLLLVAVSIFLDINNYRSGLSGKVQH